jgi:hypothetical protein
MQSIPKERLDRVRDLWMLGKSERQITRLVCAEYSITARAVRRYIVRVRDKIAGEPGTTTEAARKRAEEIMLEALEHAVSRVDADTGVAAPDYKEMSTIARRLAELHGALVQKVEHSGGVALNAKADDELLARLTRAAAGPSGVVGADAGGPSPSAAPVAPVGQTGPTRTG